MTNAKSYQGRLDIMKDFSLEEEIMVRLDAFIAAIDSLLNKAAEGEHLYTHSLADNIRRNKIK